VEVVGKSLVVALALLSGCGGSGPKNVAPARPVLAPVTATDEAPEPLEPRRTTAPSCEAGFVDVGCDESWEECREGTHRDHLSGEACSSCVGEPDQPRTCTWARERYSAFVSELKRSSCADYCDEVGDCRAHSIDNACLSGLAVPLYGMIDEEILQAAASFAKENCATLCGSEPAPRATAPSGRLACFEHRCLFVRLAYSSGSSP
jgi:hypothetical protein